jgi:TP901 family phage tail tape measure protein
MADLAQLGIQVNVTDQNSAGKLTALSTAADKLAQSSEKLEKIVSRASDVLNKLGTASEQSAKKTKTATEQAARGYALLMGDINKLNRAIKEIGTDTLGLKILSADFKTLEKEMIKAYQAGKLDIEGFKRLGASAGKLSSRLKEQRATVEDLNAARMKEADLMAKAHIQELKWAQAKKDNMALYKAEQNEIKKNTERRRADIAAIEKELIAQDKLNAKRKEVAASYSYHDREAQKYTENLKKQTELTNKFKEVLSEVGRRIKQFGAFIAAAFVLTTVIQSIQAAITTIIDFDQALKSLQAIAGATAIEAKVMGDTIKQIAADTKFSANEVAEGMQTIGKAGFTAGEALQIIQGVSNLATGALEDFNSVANLVITAVRAFGLEVVQTGQITDTFANAITKSKLSVDGLKTAFGYVGAAGSQAGLSIEEVSGTLMVLADNGIRASTMGTALRKTLLGMIAPNSDLQNALNRVGMSLDQINPGMVGYEQALKNLAPLVWDFERNTVDMAKAQEFFGIRASQVAAILIRETAEGGGISNAIKSTKELGAALKMAEKQQEGLGVKFKNLGDTIKNVALAIGEGGLNSALHTLVDALKTAAAWTEKFILSSEVVKIAGYATALAGVSAAVYGLIAALKIVLPLMITFGKTLLTTPWGLVATGIAAAIAYLATMGDKTGEATEAIKEQNVALQQTISTMDSWVNVLDEAAKKGKEFYDTALVRFVAENKELAGRIVDVVNAQDLLNGTMISSVEQIATLSEGWKEYSEIIEEAINISRFEDAETALKNFTSTFINELKVVNEKFKDATTFDVDDAGTSWENAENALKNTVKRMVTTNKEAEISLESFRSQNN